MRRAAVVSALFLVVLAVVTSSGHAQTLDPASADALAQTLRMLGDPAARAGAIAGSPGATEQDRALQRLAASPELTQEIYVLAGEVFADLARGTGGDATAMLAALERGRSDPAGFAAMLSPQTLAHLRELASRLGDARR
jgi:hypothetical protein